MPRLISRCLSLAILFVALSGLNQIAAAQTATPPAVASPAIDPKNDQACADYAANLLAKYSNLQKDDIPGISNCFLDAAGNWFMATGPNDPRIVGGPILSPEEERRSASIRTQIVDAVNSVLAWSATQPPVEDPTTTTAYATLRDQLDALYSPVLLPVGGHLKTDRQPWLNTYEAQLYGLASDPSQLVLRVYLQWQSKVTVQLWPRVCGGTLSSDEVSACNNELGKVALGYYPAHLLDDLSLAEFCRWVVDNPDQTAGVAGRLLPAT